MQLPHLPDEERLWRAVHKPEQLYKDGSVKPSFFRDNRGGLSCDLARFSSQERSRLGYATPRWPVESGLVEFSPRNVRSVGSDVEHRPDRRLRNYAHSQFTTKLSNVQEQQLVKLSRIAVAPTFPGKAAPTPAKRS